MVKPKKKYYAVTKGRETGIYTDYSKVKILIDGISGGPQGMRGFHTLVEAEAFYHSKLEKNVESGHNKEKTGNSSCAVGNGASANKRKLGGRCSSIDRTSERLARKFAGAFHSEFAMKFLAKFGYVKGDGFGKHGSGIRTPIIVDDSNNLNSFGLGYKVEIESSIKSFDDSKSNLLLNTTKCVVDNTPATIINGHKIKFTHGKKPFAAQRAVISMAIAALKMGRMRFWNLQREQVYSFFYHTFG